MGIIGELAVAITARTGKFEQGLRRSKVGLRKFERNVKKNEKAMNALTEAKRQFTKIKIKNVFLGISAAAGAAAVSFNRTASAMGEIQKRAGALQMSTQALSELAHAANQNGVEFDDLHGLLEEMNIRLSEAAKGSGSAKAALDQLNVPVAALLAMKPEEAFGQLAKHLEAIQGAEKIELADALFGGDAFKVMPLINQGADGIKRLREEAVEMGTAFDGAGVQEFLKSSKQMTSAFEGMQRQFVIQIAPAVAATIETLSELMKTQKQKIPKGRLKGETNKEATERKRDILKADLERKKNRGWFERTFGLESTLEEKKRQSDEMIRQQMKDNPLAFRTSGVERPTFSKEELREFRKRYPAEAYGDGFVPLVDTSKFLESTGGQFAGASPGQVSPFTDAHKKQVSIGSKQRAAGFGATGGFIGPRQQTQNERVTAELLKNLEAEKRQRGPASMQEILGKEAAKKRDAQIREQETGNRHLKNMDDAMQRMDLSTVTIPHA